MINRSTGPSFKVISGPDGPAGLPVTPLEVEPVDWAALKASYIRYLQRRERAPKTISATC